MERENPTGPAPGSRVGFSVKPVVRYFLPPAAVRSGAEICRQMGPVRAGRATLSALFSSRLPPDFWAADPWSWQHLTSDFYARAWPNGSTGPVRCPVRLAAHGNIPGPARIFDSRRAGVHMTISAGLSTDKRIVLDLKTKGGRIVHQPAVECAV